MPIPQPRATFPPVKSTPLWTWDTTNPDAPILQGFTNGNPTKTGIMPADLQNFVGVPLVYYYNPTTAVASGTVLSWIRQAEDWVEQNTTILLCPTWVASPPAPTDVVMQEINMVPTGHGQLLGSDYDLQDAPYDFFFPKAQDEGWMITQLRYRPLRNLAIGTDFTAMKIYAYIYPLLSEYFQVPPSWFQEDQDFGLLRLVPSANVQMLPLFAMQLAFMGFAESIPGAIWTQYTAGLTPNDYNGRFSFMKNLVLAQAAIYALSAIQGTINMGILQHETLVDGVQYKARYSEKGPFSGLIDNFTKMRDNLCQMATTQVSGPMYITV